MNNYTRGSTSLWGGVVVIAIVGSAIEKFTVIHPREMCIENYFPSRDGERARSWNFQAITIVVLFFFLDVPTRNELS